MTKRVKEKLNSHLPNQTKKRRVGKKRFLNTISLTVVRQLRQIGSRTVVDVLLDTVEIRMSTRTEFTTAGDPTGETCPVGVQTVQVILVVTTKGRFT